VSFERENTRERPATVTVSSERDGAALEASLWPKLRR
jgi:hypothetical protein